MKDSNAIFFILCAIGVRINPGNGLAHLLTRGGLRVTSKTTGNLSQACWISKLDFRSMLERGAGMIQICLKLVMVE